MNYNYLYMLAFLAFGCGEKEEEDTALEEVAEETEDTASETEETEEEPTQEED